MSILKNMGVWLVPKDQPASAHALLVLDGQDFDLRIATGLGLLLGGYAPRLLVIQSSYFRAQHEPARDAARSRPDEVFLLHCSAVSTREEAAEASPVLKRLGCTSVMIVTSWYHSRRARTVFARVLEKEGIRVSAYPVAGRTADLHTWWKSKEGRRTVSLEAAELFLTWLHLDLPVIHGLLRRLREWMPMSGASSSAQSPQAFEGLQEALTADLQASLKDAQFRRGDSSAYKNSGADGDGQARAVKTQPTVRWAAPPPSQNGAGIMKEKSFKAVNITAQDAHGRDELAEVFNAWAEKEQPSSIVHVHYYHDQDNHVRGYRIIFEKSAKALERLRPAAEEQRAA
jgi:DUF218 domain